MAVHWIVGVQREIGSGRTMSISSIGATGFVRTRQYRTGMWVEAARNLHIEARPLFLHLALPFPFLTALPLHAAVYSAEFQSTKGRG
jgi:hypothetical protein